MYDTKIVDPRPLSPPDEKEDDTCIDDFLISGAHGIYIAQIFTERFEIQGDVSKEAWETCKKGPFSADDSDERNYDYLDAWTEILDTWGYLSYEGCGNTFKYFLEQQETDGDLCLMRQFVDHDPD